LIDAIERRAARKTALVVAAALAAGAAWIYYRGGAFGPPALAGAAVALAATGLWLPSGAVRFHRAWMRFATALAFVNTRILLCAMYWGVITPVGVLRRIFGYDPLHRRGIKCETCWIARPQSRQRREGFERAF
jgi:hypothetical protein